MYEIRLHGRGGQLLQQSSQILASALMVEGKSVQLTPQAGPNRVGAPAALHLKIDEKKFFGGCRVSKPDCVIVFDDKLPRFVGVYDGLKSGGLVVINCRDLDKSLRMDVEPVKIASVDANRIASDVYGPTVFPRVGLAMLGAFARGSQMVSLDSLIEALEGHFPEEKRKHARVVRMAYKETRLAMLGRK